MESKSQNRKMRKVSEWIRKANSKSEMPAELRIALRAQIQSNRARLEKLHQAARKSKSRYPIDLTQGFAKDLTHLGKLKEGANLLRSEVFDLVEEGKIDEAAESARAIFRVGGSLTQEPMLISQLVRFGIDSVGHSVVERVLNAGVISEAQLRSLLASFEDADTTHGLVRGLVGDRAAAIPAFRFEALIQPFADDQAAPAPAPRPMLKGIRRTVAQATGIFERDLRFFLDTFETNLAIIAMPAPQSLNASNVLAALDLEAIRKHHTLSMMLLPVWTAPKEAAKP